MAKLSPKQLFLNPYLLPWNIYGHHKKPTRSNQLNFCIRGSEWYNSYMPPLFVLENLSVIKPIRSLLDSGTGFAHILKTSSGKTYQKHLSELFATNTDTHRLLLTMYRQIKEYFTLEERLVARTDTIQSADDYYTYVYLALQLMQLYMDPIEAFTTGKSSLLPLSNTVFPSEATVVSALSKSVSIETVYIPLSVLSLSDNRSSMYTGLIGHLCDVLFCTKDVLEWTLKRDARSKHYGRYMSASEAEQIIITSALKLKNRLPLNLKERIADSIQKINGVMAWSTHIPYTKKPLRTRYFSTNSVIHLATRFDSTVDAALCSVFETSSGAERQAHLLYLLRTYLLRNSTNITTLQQHAYSLYASL